MSMIVKNMEMPERCGRCFYVRWSNLHQTALCTLAQEACFEDFSTDYKSRRADFCPLVEIPTPHGRLIDADELIRELASEHTGGLDAIKKYTNADTWTSGLHTAWRLIDDASTVIEAEGSET